VDFQAELSGMVVPYHDKKEGYPFGRPLGRPQGEGQMPRIKIQPENTPKWGRRLPLTTFASGSIKPD